MLLWAFFAFSAGNPSHLAEEILILYNTTRSSSMSIIFYKNEYHFVTTNEATGRCPILWIFWKVTLSHLWLYFSCLFWMRLLYYDACWIVNKIMILCPQLFSGASWWTLCMIPRGLDILERRPWVCKTMGAAILVPKFLRELQCIW